MVTPITTGDVLSDTIERQVTQQLSVAAARERAARETALVARGHSLSIKVEMTFHYIDLGYGQRLPIYQAYDAATEEELPFWPNGCPHPFAMRGTIRERLPMARLLP